MEIKEFINHFEDILEETDINTLKPDTNYRELGEWSSLAALSTMAMINDEYDIAITADEMRSTTTFQQLFDLVSSKL